MECCAMYDTRRLWWRHTDPVPGISSPTMHFRSVVFPAPFAPTIATRDARVTLAFTPSRTGDVLVVSHDYDFLADVATDIVHFENQELTTFGGGFAGFRADAARRGPARHRRREPAAGAAVAPRGGARADALDADPPERGGGHLPPARGGVVVAPGGPAPAGVLARGFRGRLDRGDDVAFHAR